MAFVLFRLACHDTADIGLAFSVNSATDFSDAELARSVLEYLLEQDAKFAPSTFSRFPPAQIQLAGRLSDAIDTWATGGEQGREGRERRSGGIALESVHGVRYHVSWERFPGAAPASIAGIIPDAVARDCDAHRTLQKLIEDLCVLTRAFYGEVRRMVSGWDKPYDFQVRLPDVPNFLVLGPTLVEHFHKRRLLDAPVFQAGEFSPGFVSVAVTRSAYDELPEELKAKMREHLGEENFMSGGKWRYKNGGLPPLF